MTSASASASDSWTGLARGDEVGPGEVRAVDVGDTELVVWRTAEGRAVVCEARCPHQWSHLEAEGFVDGEELVCTAHFWRFDAEGHGSKLNVLGRRDEKADVQVYPCREQDGVIEAVLTPSDTAPLAGGPIVEPASTPSGTDQPPT